MSHLPFSPLAKKLLLSVAGGFAVLILSACLYMRGQSQNDFPDGYDAVQAAPKSHKVLFENALVRVLEVDVPKAGETVPMHHHRWPSLVVDWDTGGGRPHIRYHRAGQPVRDVPAVEEPNHPGKWSVHWMEPEPMHSIDIIAYPKNAMEHKGDPASLRIEIKTHP